MCSTSVTLHPARLIAKPLTPAACNDICRPVHEKAEAEVRRVHMNWIVVSDTNVNRRLQMHWQAE
jgi:hypothetical protein